MSWFSNLFASKRVMPTSLCDENFDAQVLKSDRLTLVDFWSPGCAPCKQLEDVIIGIASDKAETVKVCELNITDGMQIAARYGVRGTPTVIYF
ncbi:MAG: thioredoxin [Myxococcales bacterium]|nr:MAG: thioredoxin [Myxococcales bacterium]